jgi:hypothetical protein
MAYRGHSYPIPIGIDGWSANKNQTQIRSTQLIQAQDITYEYGTLGKEGGATLYTPNPISGSPTILAGVDWWPDPNTQRQIIVGSDGFVRKDSGNGSFSVTLASGQNLPGRSPEWAVGGIETQANPRKLFLFTDTNQPLVLTGDAATMHPIASPPADWATRTPTTGIEHLNRMWAASGHFVYYSLPSNHEDFTSGSGTGQTGLLSIQPGSGEEIVDIESFKGMLLVFKRPYGIYFVDANDPTITNWSVNTVSDILGAAGPGCVCSIDNDVLFMDSGGSINLLSAVMQELPKGTFAVSSLTYAGNIDPYIRETFNFQQLGKTQSFYYAAKREVHFSFIQAGSGIPNARMIVDYNRPDINRFRYSYRDICPALWLRKDITLVPRPMMGDNLGQVWNMDQATRSKGSAGYLSQFQVGHEDFSGMYVDWPSVKRLAGKNKLFHFLELVADPRGNWNISVDVYVDSNYKMTAQFNLGVSGKALDAFVLDSDVLAGSAVLRKRRRITGEGRRISLVGSTQGPGQDFSLDEFLVEFGVGSE